MRKTCCRCKVRKDISKFNKRSRSSDGHASSCKLCAQEAAKLHYHSDEHKDTIKAKSRIYKQENPEKVRNIRYKSLYGITLEQFNKMKKDQHDLCATCGKKPDTTLCVDHDHTTGKVRGLLCSSCNRALGLLQDDIDVLRQSVKYLRKHKK